MSLISTTYQPKFFVYGHYVTIQLSAHNYSGSCLLTMAYNSVQQSVSQSLSQLSVCQLTGLLDKNILFKQTQQLYITGNSYCLHCGPSKQLNYQVTLSKSVQFFSFSTKLSTRMSSKNQPSYCQPDTLASSTFSMKTFKYFGVADSSTVSAYPSSSTRNAVTC